MNNQQAKKLFDAGFKKIGFEPMWDSEDNFVSAPSIRELIEFVDSPKVFDSMEENYINKALLKLLRDREIKKFL